MKNNVQIGTMGELVDTSLGIDLEVMLVLYQRDHLRSQQRLAVLGD